MPAEQPVVPEELAAALAANSDAESAFAKLPPSHKREHIKWIEEGKKPETRQNRIQKVLQRLVAPKPSDESSTGGMVRKTAR